MPLMPLMPFSRDLKTWTQSFRPVQGISRPLNLWNLLGLFSLWFLFSFAFQLIFGNFGLCLVSFLSFLSFVFSSFLGLHLHLGTFRGLLKVMNQLIGFREKIEENPIFRGKIYDNLWFPIDFPLSQPIEWITSTPSTRPREIAWSQSSFLGLRLFGLGIFGIFRGSIAESRVIVPGSENLTIGDECPKPATKNRSSNIWVVKYSEW